MANNAPKIAAKERREPMAAVDKKAAILVSQIKSSRHFIAFTGAGVSTSAGKPRLKENVYKQVLMTLRVRDT